MCPGTFVPRFWGKGEAAGRKRAVVVETVWAPSRLVAVDQFFSDDNVDGDDGSTIEDGNRVVVFSGIGGHPDSFLSAVRKGTSQKRSRCCGPVSWRMPVLKALFHPI